MSDNNSTSSNSPAPDGNDEVKDAPDGTKDKDKAEFVPRSELEEAMRRRDDAAKRARTAEKELEALKKSIDGKGREDAKKGGDVEALQKSFDEELTAKDTQIEGLTNKLHGLVVENQVRQLASELGAISADQVWGLIGSQFEARDEDGKLICAVRGEVVKPTEYIRRFLEKNPNLAKNPRAQGSGASGAGDGNLGKTMAEINAMSPKEQQDYFKKNPAAAKTVIAGARK